MKETKELQDWFQIPAQSNVDSHFFRFLSPENQGALRNTNAVWLQPPQL